MSWRRFSPSLAAWAALIAVTAVGCVRADAPGVGVSNIPADIVFGVEAEDDAKPANTDPQSDADPAASDDSGLPPQIFTEPPEKNFPRPPLRAAPAPGSECPPAALNEFPDETAPLNVPPEESRLPKTGLYRWQKSGSQTTLQGSELPISGFETRGIRNVELESLDGDRMVFTYDTVQPDFGTDNVVITTYQVDTDAESAEANSTVTPHRASTGEPERGLVIKRIEVQDRDGQTVSTFEPVTGLLILPLPIRTGEEFTSVAVDPRSRFTIRYEAQTVRRARVDACGEIIEGWLVEGTQTMSSGDVRDYRVIVAPHLGALLLNESVTLENDSGTYNLDFTIGQREPDPVDEGDGS